MLDINTNHEILIENIATLLKYQFATDLFSKVLEDRQNMKFDFSKNTGKLKSLIYQNKLFLVYKPNVSKFSLTISAGIFLKQNTAPPFLRVKVLSEVQEFIKSGKSVFSKHVIELDNKLRPNDEVIVVNENDELLAIGKLCIPPILYANKSVGMAVEVRKGIN